MSAGDALAAIKTRAEGHTPGPWVVNDEEQTVRADGRWVGAIMFDRSCESRADWLKDERADAELIAAAPRLLAALEAALSTADELIESNTGTPGPTAFGLKVAARQIRSAIEEALS